MALRTENRVLIGLGVLAHTQLGSRQPRLVKGNHFWWTQKRDPGWNEPASQTEAKEQAPVIPSISLATRGVRSAESAKSSRSIRLPERDPSACRVLHVIPPGLLS